MSLCRQVFLGTVIEELVLLGAGLHMMSSPAAQQAPGEGMIQFSSSPDCKLLLFPLDQLR